MIAVGSALPGVSVADDRGELLTLTSLIGDAALLLFFKRSCGTCELSMPVLQHLRSYAPRIPLLAVSQDSVDETAEFFATYEIAMDVVYDHSGFEASRAFDVDGVPTLVLVEDGVVTWTSVGWSRARADELGRRLEQMTGKNIQLKGIDALPALRPG